MALHLNLYDCHRACNLMKNASCRPVGVILMQPNEVEVVPGGLAGIVDGLERLKQNKVAGKKLVVHPNETA